MTQARTAARVSCGRRELGAIRAVARGGDGREDEAVASSESGTEKEEAVDVVGGAVKSIPDRTVHARSPAKWTESEF